MLRRWPSRLSGPSPSTRSRRRWAGASGWSAAPPRTSRWRPPSSTTSASSGPSATTSALTPTLLLSTRGTNTDDVERVPGGTSFFWAGEYGWDLNSRETLDTQLGVFETFQPKLSAAARQADVLFLANIQPSLQRDVLEQCEQPRFVALDSMNLWIEIARSELVDVIGRVDCLILNDAELRQLTGRPSLVAAAREALSWGPTAIVAKQGEYGAALLTADGFFALPAYPLETVVDPTGAGDTFAGGFVGYLSRHLDQLGDEATLRRAMAYGTALASFNVEQFGTDRVARLEAGELHERVAGLQQMTHLQATREREFQP